MSCLIADRASDSDAFHAELAERNIEAAIAAPVPRLETVPSAQRRGMRYGWLKRGRRMAPPAISECAQRSPGFLYPAGICLWLNQDSNTTGN